MPQSKSALQQSASKPSRSLLRQPKFWLVTLILLVGVTTARLMKAKPIPLDPLHGDAEDATVGLSDLLAKTPADRRLPLLLKDAQDSSPGLRYAAVDGLGSYHTKEATDAIESAFRDSSLTVRDRSLETLADADVERGFRLLLSAMHDDDTLIRGDAFSQLSARLGNQKIPQPERAIPTLLTTLDSPNPAEVLTAMALLHKITGKPWSVKSQATETERAAAITRWKDWAKANPSVLAVSPDFQNLAPRPPQRTDAAPDFSISDLDGKSIALTNQKGRVTLLNFWGTWCGPCQGEIPDLVKLNEEMRQNIDVIGIALSEDSEQTLRDWCKAHHVVYRQAMATDNIVHVFGDIHEVPVSILIDRKGQIRYRWDGPSDYATFRAAAERLLKE